MPHSVQPITWKYFIHYDIRYVEKAEDGLIIFFIFKRSLKAQMLF